MTVRILVDTNVVIYTIDNRDPQKKARCRAWVSALAQQAMITISPQVLNEAHNVLRKKFAIPSDRAARILEPWTQYCDAPLRVQETLAALEIEQKWKVAWWDALLIASAAASGCTHLLTEDLPSAPAIDGVAIIDPFAVTPGSVLGET